MWSYDPKAYADGQVPNGTGFVHRGVGAWRDAKSGKLRILMNSRYRLIQLDAETGKPVSEFGDNGVVNLVEGLRWQTNPKNYTNTSPVVIYKDLIIVGNGVADRLAYKQDPPGDVRAFHARTGKLVWTFYTVPRAGEFGVETWGNGSEKITGHTNVWAPMTLDEARGLIYLPIGTPSNDFYGGARPGAESLRRFAGLRRRQHGQAQVALPSGASRPVGLRHAGTAGAGDDPRGGEEDRCGGAVNEDRMGLRVRSGYW